MVTTDRQKGIGKPVISLIEITGFGVFCNTRSHGLLYTGRDRKSKDFAVSLIDAKDDPFTGCSPATLARFLTTEHDFIIYF